MTDDPKAPDEQVDPAAAPPEAPAEAASSPAPELPAPAEASRSFGPEWQGSQSADAPGVAKSGNVEATVGVYPGSVIGVELVKGDDVVPLEDYHVEAIEGAAGVAVITGKAKGADGDVVLRVHVDS